MRDSKWLLVVIPALCACFATLVAILHYLHIVEDNSTALTLMFSALALYLCTSITLGMTTSGNATYILFSALMFFIVFVFAITTVTSHNCEHHSSRPQIPETHMLIVSPELLND
ncbi:hypothetical protein L2750_03255 [Shewanella submarina]|uniref:Uncharacterized protein n=1 Tax=Shewanella submarina TaxID=2016376 RepID=A0ABV7GMZ8_9GAMM|nr:hypothetical protein [Shewanella submarina]MCL1036174.1 hypothetical protein [Shewanella submarina]